MGVGVLLCTAMSCSQKEVLSTDGIKLVPATIIAGSSNFDTKTTAVKNDTLYNIFWEAQDGLSVFNSVDNVNRRFTSSNSGEVATFSGEIPYESAITYAILPYDPDASVNGQTVYTSIPAEQNGDFGNIVLAGWPREAGVTPSSTDFHYQFEAVCGILKFSFDPEKIGKYQDVEDQHVVSISITADRPIAGDAQISYADGVPVMTANPNSTGSNQYNTITITAADKVNGFAKDDYYIATLPIIKGESIDTMGISIKCITKEGKVAYVRSSLPGNGKKHILTANVVKNIGTVKTNDYVLNNGEFTVKVVSGKPSKVSFSPGNLQYLASANEGAGLFRFAPNQYDVIGELGNLTSTASIADDGARARQSEWIDLFPFGHSGWTYSNHTFPPYRATYQESGFMYFKSYESSLVGNCANGDWGVYNSILNGNVVNDPGVWRLLTYNEFALMCNLDSKGYRNPYVKEVSYSVSESKTVKQRLYYLRCGIKTGVFEGGIEIIRYGIMLFPDFFEWPEDDVPLPVIDKDPYLLINYKNCTNEDAVKYSLSEFSVLEKGGVVFLPCAGHRNSAGSDQNVYFMHASAPYEALSSFGNEGHYWTSSFGQAVVTRPANALTNDSGAGKLAKSVRLVKNGQGWN